MNVGTISTLLIHEASHHGQAANAYRSSAMEIDAGGVCHSLTRPVQVEGILASASQHPNEVVDVNQAAALRFEFKPSTILSRPIYGDVPGQESALLLGRTGKAPVVSLRDRLGFSVDTGCVHRTCTSKASSFTRPYCVVRPFATCRQCGTEGSDYRPKD